MGTKRDLKAIEAWRIAGARMLDRKVPQAVVTRESGDSRQAVSVWARQLAEVNGAVGKLNATPLGRPERPDAEQREAFSRMLVAGALQAGLATELWTVKRPRSAIERGFGVRCGMMPVVRASAQRRRTSRRAMTATAANPTNNANRNDARRSPISAALRYTAQSANGSSEASNTTTSLRSG